MINLPTADRKNELSSFEVIPEGFFDVSLETSEHEVSKAGNQMMKVRFIVDNGPSQGAQIENRFVFGLESQFGEQLLQRFCNRSRRADGSLDAAVDPATGAFLYYAADGSTTTDATLARQNASGDLDAVNLGGFLYSSEYTNWPDFCAQFSTAPALRVHIKVWHSYDVEQMDGTWIRKVSKERFDKSKDNGDRCSTKANMSFESAPKAPPILKVIPKQAAGPAPAAAAYPGSAASSAPPAAANGVAPAMF